MQELALSLALKCLSFDFVGTSIDESSEEFGTVQVCFVVLLQKFSPYSFLLMERSGM